MLDPVSILSTLAAGNPVDHVVNHSYITSDDGWWIWSANQTNLVLSGLIILILGPWLAKEIGTGEAELGNDRYVTKNVFAHMVEVIAVYLRDNVVEPLLHERTNKFMPFLWSLFFFILINNLLGLIPFIDLWQIFVTQDIAAHKAFIGGTATQNLFVTAVLAAISFLVINYAGIRELGVGGYAKHLTGGAPPALWPLMIPIEILGTFIKPIALAIRLFANMTAGHVLLATLFLFVEMASQAGLILLGGVGIVSVVGAVAIFFLELFVAFLQAFIFMFLTTVFIGQLSHHGDHHEEHAHDTHHAEETNAEPVAA